jgi:signal transduction histidine kinase
MLGMGVGLLAALVAIAWCARLLWRLERIAQAMHELRAPLCAVRLGLHAAGREPGGAALASLDQEMERAALALDDLEAARGGRRPRARRGEVRAADVLERVCASWAPLAWPTGRELRVEGAVGAAPVLADTRRLAQALGILVANALEHGAGPVVLSARSWAGRVRFEVADDGNGPARSLRRLIRGRYGGRGARGRGLAIAARIARDHGGRLVREPGGGCRMVLELPARGASAPTARRDLLDAVAAPLDRSGSGPSTAFGADGLLAGGVRVGGVARPRVRR